MDSQNLKCCGNCHYLKGKSWLPHDYGTKKYQNLAQDEKDLIKSFEGKKIYNQNVVESGASLFRIKKILQLTLNQEAEAA